MSYIPIYKKEDRDMDVPEVLKALPEMSKAALCQRWQECFSKPAPEGVRMELMVRMLAYRIQEQAFGALNPKIRRRLPGIRTSNAWGN